MNLPQASSDEYELIWDECGFPVGEVRKPHAVIAHQRLLACYLSGQMSEAQMVAHERADPAFAAYAAGRA